MHIKEELNEGPRIQRKQTEQKRKTRAKNKNVTPEISKMASANKSKTPEGYKLTPFVSNHLC